MGLFDDAKKNLDGIADKASDLAGEHADKIEDGLEKAAEFIDDKTGGKHSDKIDGAVDKAKDALGKLGDDK